jgi:hypothetical protein
MMLEQCGAAVLLNGGVIYDGLWHTYSPEGGAVNSVFQRSKPIIVNTVTDLFGKSAPYEGDDQLRNLTLLLEKVSANSAPPIAPLRRRGVRRAIGNITCSQ